MKKELDELKKNKDKLLKEKNEELEKTKNEYLAKGKDIFMNLSRTLAEKAQKKESITIQPKEKLDGAKGTITITNYLGGNYYFTSDEVELHNNDVWLIDAKHTKTNNLPSSEDIKDGLLKMMLFTNLKEVKIKGKNFDPIPILKLTNGSGFIKSLKDKQKELLEFLKREAKTNKFKILINEDFVV